MTDNMVDEKPGVEQVSPVTSTSNFKEIRAQKSQDRELLLP
jgi:hypothetical protein